MALYTLLQQKYFRIVALLTTVTEGYDRISMHGVRRELLRRQADSLRLPLHEVCIPPQCVNSIYEARMEEALRLFHDQGVRTVAFGDIFLEDLRAYREKNLARIGMTALFPLWKRDTRELIQFFHQQHFRAMPTLAAKTGSFTPSSSMARFFNLPFPFEREKLSTAMVLCFAIYCRKWREQQNERRNVSQTKFALPHAARFCPNSACRRLAHRSASLEFHPRWRDSALLRRRSA